MHGEKEKSYTMDQELTRDLCGSYIIGNRTLNHHQFGLDQASALLSSALTDAKLLLNIFMCETKRASVVKRTRLINRAINQSLKDSNNRRRNKEWGGLQFDQSTQYASP